MIQSGHIRGAVILVSHDRHLVELTVDRLWLVADSTAREFDGSLDDYRRQILSGSNDQKTDTEPTAEGTARRHGVPLPKRASAPARCGRKSKKPKS